MTPILFKARIITAALLLVTGLVTVWQSWSLPMGKLQAIGAGFFPQVFGTLLTVLSSVMLLLLFLQRGQVKASPAADLQEETVPAVEGETPAVEGEEPVHVRGLISFIVVFIVFIVLTHFAGFVIASMAAVAGAGYLLSMRGWRLLLLTVLVSGINYLVFDYWLGVSLPAGIWFQ
ncbi:hypothetical protein PA598K_05073 [Paenibacillus sp. 598K]|uniref:tripartite tricarboxylate transporter TctB family protein n=1 Tax=Paenibacillus sp. 598K TaxID=1117987 RepID=UPI000FFA8BEB|nr:tripartite tricarboxylate transporter TctB family protein [Paenibacillus sp. 598K]GBF76595.1 hypothetical protein PA598K_05073 [Paenibacillus sp. 598K]